MRVMVVRPGADWSVGDIARGWIWGLEQRGVEVVDARWDWWFNVHRQTLLKRVDDVDGPRLAWTEQEAAEVAADHLLAKVYESEPDVILVVCGWEIPPRVYAQLAAAGERVVLHHTESPYEDDRQVTMAGCAGLHLVNDPLGAQRLTAVGARAVYAPQCYRPRVHYPGDGVRDVPFAFVGSGFAGRREFFEAMSWPVPPVLAGQWVWEGDGPDPLAPYQPDWLEQPLDNEAAAALYRRTLTSLNLYRADRVQRPELVDGWAMGPREIELAACGVWFARQPRPESDEVLPMLPTFTTPDEAAELIGWALTHPDARQDAADKARAAVADRTFDNLAADLLDQLAEAPVAA